ncbi:MAG: hypothetical protein AABX70_05630 [Nanoarchaeota archaeon]
MTNPSPLSNMSKEEQIGFHKGSLSTLTKERAEMLKILNIVEQFMQMHIASLKELGVDLEKEAEKVVKDGPSKPKIPIEDVLK